MTSILYSSANCPHSLKAAIFLSEKGTRFHRVEVDLSRREQKSELYLSKNLRGTVPAYEDSNGVIGDSLEIMRYIDANTPEPHLFPDDPKALAEVLAWIERGDNDFWDVSHHLYWQLIEPPATGTDWTEVARLKAKGRRLLDELDSILSQQPYVCGMFSAADVALLPWVYGYQRFNLPEPGEFSSVMRWRDTLSRRESFTANYKQEGVALQIFLSEQQAAT